MRRTAPAREGSEASVKRNDNHDPLPEFRRAWWLPGAHLQSTWGPMFRSRCLVSFEREKLETADGDELILDHLGGDPAHPRLLLLHGLEGSSFSPYVQGFAANAQARGWSVTALNFRSCARDPEDTITWIPNRRPRMYHSGETTDLDFVVRTLHRRQPGTPVIAAGVSLGGNVLLKWLGENPEQAMVRAAAVVSAPYDLAAGANHMQCAGGRFYVGHFLPTLLAKLDHLVKQFPEVLDRIDVDAARRARDFYPFDDATTAPLHGFAGAADYYDRCSSMRVVDRVTTPTLCLNAADDPFLPRSVLDELRERASDAVDVMVTPNGGHVGFVSGPSPLRPRYWAEPFVVDWLAARLS